MKFGVEVGCRCYMVEEPVFTGVERGVVCYCIADYVCDVDSSPVVIEHCLCLQTEHC